MHKILGGLASRRDRTVTEACYASERRHHINVILREKHGTAEEEKKGRESRHGVGLETFVFESRTLTRKGNVYQWLPYILINLS
ncbi:hypothetical protein GBA52_002596 [Prunus armeniaca]|nr:hypothetical protein GBA52_002596 [Prunus armeniaca]